MGAHYIPELQPYFKILNPIQFFFWPGKVAIQRRAAVLAVLAPGSACPGLWFSQLSGLQGFRVWGFAA